MCTTHAECCRAFWLPERRRCRPSCPRERTSCLGGSGRPGANRRKDGGSQLTRAATGNAGMQDTKPNMLCLDRENEMILSELPTCFLREESEYDEIK
jgi:hypothetical protein